MTAKSLSFLVCLSFLLPMDNVVAQADKQKGNSRFVLTLNDSNVASLKSLGMIQSRELGANTIGSIAAIQIQFNAAETDQAVVLKTDISVSGNACQIELNDAMLDTIRQQPVRIDVPDDSTFSRVYLKYKSPQSSIDSSSQSAENQMSGSNRSPVVYRHYVKLTQNETLEGQMDLSDALKFKTKFGEIEISVAQINGIRFHIDGDDAAMVVLKNGDSITGVPVENTFKLATDWGEAEFETTYVEAITISPNARFEQSTQTGFGPRWQLQGQ